MSDNGNVELEIVKGMPTISISTESGSMGKRVSIVVSGEDLDTVLAKLKEVWEMLHESSSRRRSGKN